jgi:hypothetical protein
MTVAEKHAELVAACWQTQGEVDRAREDVERAMKFHDRVPDGDRRRPEAVQRMNGAMDRYRAAELAAGVAADALIAFEAGS